MKVQYKNICSIRQAEVEFPLGKMVCIKGESNQGKSSLFYGLVDGFTNSQNFKKWINNQALRDNQKAFGWIGIFDEDGNQFQVEAGTNYLYYRANDAKYEKVGRKNIFELMERQIPGLLYDPEDSRQIMNFQGEDDGLFPIDRSDKQIFKTYERLLSLSNTSEVLHTIKLDAEDIDVKMSDRLKTIQQYTEKSSKIDTIFEKVDATQIEQAIKTLESLMTFNDEIVQSCYQIKKTAEYVQAFQIQPDFTKKDFDIQAFKDLLTDCLIVTNAVKLKEKSSKEFNKINFNVQSAIELGQDYSVATMLKNDIDALNESIKIDKKSQSEVSIILESIEICPLCGKPMGECND